MKINDELLNKSIQTITDGKFKLNDPIESVESRGHFIDIAKVPQTVLDEIKAQIEPNFNSSITGNRLYINSYRVITGHVVGLTYMFAGGPKLDLEFDGFGHATPVDKCVTGLTIFTDGELKDNDTYNAIMEKLRPYLKDGDIR